MGRDVGPPSVKSFLNSIPFNSNFFVSGYTPPTSQKDGHLWDIAKEPSPAGNPLSATYTNVFEPVLMFKPMRGQDSRISPI